MIHAIPLILLLSTTIIIRPAAAVEPSELLDNPVLETRARDISKGLRCVVCQNQSIDDSDASLARDLRVLVRERLVSGESDQEVIEYVVSRYGDFVLLKPPFKAATLVLWFGPLLMVGLALLALITFFRRQQKNIGKATAPALNDSDRRRIDALLAQDHGRKKP
jgi:cytochrome c-type biogenesis protein CcmH